MADMSVVQQLHDIHLPPPVSMWPFAIGWWLILFGGFMTTLFVWKAYGFWSQMSVKRFFLQQLQSIKRQYEDDKNAAYALQSLNLLLKKAALYFYPREEVASLHGESWVNFLVKTAGKLDIQEIRELLNEKVYQQHIQSDITPGFVMVKHWIEQQRKPCMN